MNPRSDKNVIFYVIAMYIFFALLPILVIASDSYASDYGKISIHSKGSWEITLDGNYLGEISTIDYVPLGKHIIEAKNTPYFPIRKEVYVNYSGQVLSVVIDGYEHDLFEYDYEKDGQLVVSDNWLKGRRHNGEFSDSGEYLSLKKDGSTIKLRWKLYVRRKDGFKIGKGDYTKEFYTSLNLQIGKDSTELSISGKDVFSVETKELVWNNHSINLGFYGFRIQQIGPLGDQQ